MFLFNKSEKTELILIRQYSKSEYNLLNIELL